MLNKEEIVTIINKKELADLECIQILEQYIYDMKQQVVKINRPQGLPCFNTFPPTVDFELMMRMYNKAASFYFNKYRDG